MSEILFDTAKLADTLENLNTVYSNLSDIDITPPADPGIGQTAEECAKFLTAMEQVRQAMLEMVKKTMDYFSNVASSAEAQDQAITGGGSR